MKSRIVTPYIFFMTAFATAMVMCLSNQDVLVKMSGAGLVLVSVAWMFRNWMQSIVEFVQKTDKILNQDRKYSAWSFSPLVRLNQNQELIAKKFDMAAQSIANLANPQKTDITSGLIANDAVGKALQNIRTEMLRIKDEEEKRAWITQGLAHFSEVLRNKAEVQEYCNQIIGNLVKYIKANQGTFFIEYENAEGARYLELMGCYAYEKRKYAEGKVRVFEGEGLLGQCMLEKDYIYLTDVPKDYIKITSGLGSATPRNIVIAPLIFNETFCGAIELALFDVMKPHEMEFLRNVCENIASEIFSLKNIQHTTELLEESNALTQELQTREEAMNKNMEELLAAQEEMNHKQAELTGIVNAIDITLATAEFDLRGRFKSANDIFLKVMGFEFTELNDKTVTFLMGHEQSMVMMWENLRLGKSFSGEFKMKNKIGKELWLSGTFNPIIIKADVPEKIVMFAQFITQEKEKLNDLNGVVQALKHTLPVVEFNDQFVCKTANEKAMKIFGISRLELRNKRILDFIAPYYHLAWKKRQYEILDNEFTSMVLPMVTPDSETNYEVTVSTIKDQSGKVTRFIVLFVKEVHERVSVLAAV